MAIVQISKIIQRQGDLADLPQLDVAEIGYATDAKRLFIGDELPNTPDPTLLYNTEILTQNSVDGTSIIYDPITGVISSVGGGGGGGGTVTSVAVSGGSTGLTTTGGPILTFGTISLGGVLNVAHGGTGANTANQAFINLAPDISNAAGQYLTTDGTTISWAVVDSLPSQANNSGKYLTTDGSNASWAVVDSLPSQANNSGKYLTTNGSNASWTNIAAGSNNQIQFNVGGSLAASNTLTYNYQSDVLTVGDLLADSLIESGNGQGMTVSANQALTLQSVNDSIAMALPAGTTNKITVTGPTAIDYSTGLSSSDLVNKRYVDTYVANAISAAAYTLPTASTTVLGGVKVDGTKTLIDGDGVLTISNASSAALGLVRGTPLFVSGVNIFDDIGAGLQSYIQLVNSGYGSGYIDNNSTVTITHDLGRVPIVMFISPDANIIPTLSTINSNTFSFTASGGGGNFLYYYW